MKSVLHGNWLVALVALVAGVAVLGTGCDGGHEGDRCVPTSLRSSDECGAGLSCQQVGGCGESYCCPSDPSKSASPYCNGAGFAGCPGPDGGDAASDAPPGDAPPD